MHNGQFEITSYEVGLWDHRSAGQDGFFFAFGPKRMLTVYGRDPDTNDKYAVWFIFGAECRDQNQDLTLGAMFAPAAYDPAHSNVRAAFWVAPPEDHYADLYAILRHEKPIYFHYKATSAPPGPVTTAPSDPDDYNTADWAASVFFYQLNTGKEPVGEGVDANATKRKLETHFRFPGT